INKLFRNKSFQATDISFICEQDGPTEKELKKEWCALFEKRTSILSAYLVRARYGDQKYSQDNFDVILCIKNTNGNDPRLAQETASIFSSRFNKDEHVDILFINDGHEFKIKEIANAFYKKC
ncbi:MAG: enhanced serine sensitivity protein SseB C-terminal domain-containing protein, partial [Candidatus Babeliaceae bacterium]|nr:enhanced serine sensitivity protein SseB C-terminal domain-containing protein [Candidatus Babeliaceae bacterium]